MTTPAPQSLGTLGRYELLSRLGAGGMGEVFLARATGTAGFETRVVIKKMLPHLAGNAEFAQRFVEEGKLVVRLRHAGIVQVLDLGEHEGDVYLAMEHVDGRDLRHLLRLSRACGLAPTPELAATLLCRVLEALDYAHRLTDEAGRPLGLIHRDVTPSNVLLSRSGDVKLGDFGIARAARSAAPELATGPEGKVAYMSPQQAAGQPLDGRSDQFSVGVIAWELLAGRRPFEAPTDAQTLALVRACQPGSLADAAPGLPAEVVAVVDRLLAREPEARFASADEARRALQQWLNGVGATLGAREIAAWVEAVLQALPPGLRDAPPAPLSVDDLLRLGMRDGGEGTATHTATPLPELAAAAPATRTPSRATPLPVAPLDPPDAPSSPLGRPPEPLTPPPARSRAPLFALLVLLNVLLLGSVAWLLFADGTRPAAQAAAEAVQTDAPPAPRPPVAAPQPEAPTPPSPAPAPQPEPVVAEAPATGRSTGALLTAAAQRAAEPPVPVTIRVSPAGAQVAIAGLGSGPSPRTVEVPRGAELAVTARLEGHQSRHTTVVAGEEDVVSLTLKADGRGQVRFRFFPASARVRVDGRDVETGGRNVVELDLTVGAHQLELVGPRGERRKVSFRVSADKVTNLATVHLEASAVTPKATP